MAINTSGSFTTQSYYDRQLLESASTRLVHAKFGQKRSIPKNNGKRVEFRRWDLFDADAAMEPLQEGVTPAGQTLSQTTVEAEVKQYGAYVEVSDVMSFSMYDQVLTDSTELLGEQLGNVVEWVTRDAMCAGTNVQFANGKTSRVALTSADKLTVNEIRKAVRTLKRAKARTFDTNGRKPHFICICSPEATYDLQDDTLWQNVSAYSNSEQIYSGEIGRLFGVVFVESTEAKIFSQSLLTKVAAGGHTAASADVSVSSLTDAAIAYLKTASPKIKIGTAEYTVSSVNKATSTITLTTPIQTKLADGTIIFSEDAGAIDAATGAGASVHATLVFGKDSYGVIDIEGEGTLVTILKGLGSAGSLDPLDQRATAGAKVAAYTAKILNSLWLLRIEHGVSL